MDTKNIGGHVYDLAVVTESDDRFVSCYVNLENGLPAALVTMQRRQAEIEAGLSPRQRQEVRKVLERIKTFLTEEVNHGCKGAAVFARGGAEPFFLGLQFYLPLPDGLIVDTLPNIYQLVEMKDTYHRYVIFLITAVGSRILTVNCGTVSERLWRDFPEARDRIGKEWMREHYRDNVRELRHRVLKDQIGILEQMMKDEGLTHLVLAGNPNQLADVRKALSKQLADRVIGGVGVSGSASLDEIVQATIPSFIAQEESESQNAVEQLCRRVNTDGLACIGASNSLRALANCQVDLLILAQEFADEAQREELVRLAEQTETRIELVKHNELLESYGGVGCLLRYRLPGQWRQRG